MTTPSKLLGIGFIAAGLSTQAVPVTLTGSYITAGTGAVIPLSATFESDTMNVEPLDGGLTTYTGKTTDGLNYIGSRPAV